MNAESLTKHIIDTCTFHQLDPSQIISQGYDGGSVMSGSLSGAQAQIRQYSPNAIYIHCNAHCLNLCLVESVKVVKHARKFCALIEALYVFLHRQSATCCFWKIKRDYIQQSKFVNYNNCQNKVGMPSKCSCHNLLHVWSSSR